MIKKIASKILDLLFPQKCFGCKKVSEYICLKCLKSIPRKNHDSPDTITIFDYRNNLIKHLIWKLKYEGASSIALNVAKIIHEETVEKIAEIKMTFPIGQGKIVVIPVPMHPVKQKHRGFNQAELIAKKLCEIDPKSFLLKNNIVEKIKNTENQMKIKNKETRIHNVMQSFSIKNKSAIRKKLVLLLDDVITTGATTSECKKVLIEAGAGKVIIIALAH